MNDLTFSTTKSERRLPAIVFRRVWPSGIVLAALLSGLLFLTPSRSNSGAITRLIQHINPELAAAPTSGCQIDPLHVGYTAAYQRPGGPFVVTQTTITGIDAGCYGATLTVVLNDATGRAISGNAGSVLVTGPSVVASISPSPAVASVAQVSLALASWVSNGNVTIGSGQNYNYKGLTVNGNVTVQTGGTFNCSYCTVNGSVSSAGTLMLANTSVTKDLQTSGGPLSVTANSTIGGNLQASGGGPITLAGSFVGGSLQLQSLTSSSPGTVCGMTSTGNLVVQSNSEPLQLGGSAYCSGNSTSGNLQVQSNTAKLTIGAGSATSTNAAVAGNSASNNIQVQYNTGSASTMGGNRAGNNCTLGSNTPIVQVSGTNTAGHNNSCQVGG